MTSHADEDRPRLVIPRAQLEHELSSQIAKGHGYRALRPSTGEELKTYLNKVQAWGSYNLELLRRSFSTPAIADEYQENPPRPEQSPDTVEDRVGLVHDVLLERTRFLAHLKTRLHLYEDVAAGHATSPSVEKPMVFVVHGHDRGAELEVVRFLERAADVIPIVLRDQPNQGRTIIEKFEDYAGNSKYAIVLLTADDEGGVRGGSMQPRARQNVIFELGFFFGQLKRSKVAALVGPGVEHPSDISGLAYIPLDPHGGWRFTLGREMKAAGLQVDLNKL